MVEEEVREMLHDLTEHDDRGVAVVLIGTVLTLYFRNGHCRDVRNAVLDCFNEYLLLHGNKFRWWVTEGGHPSPVASLTDKDMTPYLLSDKYERPDSDLNWAFLWHGGERREDASTVAFFGFGASRADSEYLGALSFISVKFPLATEEGAASELLTITEKWAKRLKPLHGYAGAAVFTSPDDATAAKSEGRLVYYGGRYPGLELDFPLSHALHTRQGIKGVNWLTVLSDELLNAAGGIDQLVAHLPKGGKFKTYQGGGVLIASPLPCIGDRYEGIDVPAYRQVAQMLKPIRITLHPAVRRTPAGFDRQGFEGWLNRLDNAS